MSFLYAYKRLERLCSDVMNDRKGISAYIDEMKNTPRGSFYVKNWDKDLDLLKHYREVRNEIAHNPVCDESNMCKAEDVFWIEDFYSRIINQSDPLTLYRKSIGMYTNKPTSHYAQNSAQKRKTNPLLWGALIVVLLWTIALIFFLAK